MQVKNCVFSKVDFLRLMHYSNGFGVFVGSAVRWSRQQSVETFDRKVSGPRPMSKYTKGLTHIHPE